MLATKLICVYGRFPFSFDEFTAYICPTYLSTGFLLTWFNYDPSMDK